MIGWNNLQELLKERGNKAKLSKATGISTGNITDWFNTDKPAQPSADALVKVAEYFNCSTDYLLDRTDSKEFNTQPTIIYRFPSFNQQAAAGIGRLDISDGYTMEEFIVDNIPDNAVFAMEIAGESMYDEKTNYLLRTGSKVLIDPKISKYNLNEMVVIVNFRGKTICKRYIEKDNYILFQSDNEDFKNENKKSTDDPEHKIIGVVLGVIEDGKFISVK